MTAALSCAVLHLFRMFHYNNTCRVTVGVGGVTVGVGGVTVGVGGIPVYSQSIISHQYRPPLGDSKYVYITSYVHVQKKETMTEQHF